MSNAAQEILIGLENTVAALAAGQTALGAELLDGVQAACDAMAARGETFPPGDLERARALHQVCVSTATRVGTPMLASLLQTATLRKASHAYRSEP